MTEIDKLIEHISNLDLKVDMASFQIKAADYDHIPQFNGNPHNLLKFVTVCRQVHGIVCKPDNTFRVLNEQRLLSKILARLTEDADYINTTCEFQTVEQLLAYLENTFRDSRSIEQLSFELFNLKINFKEHPLDFLQKIDRIRTLIISKYRIEKFENRSIIIATLERNILYHFFTQMPLHIRTYLMTKTEKLKTLDDLRNLIQNENHLLFDDLINSGNMSKPGEYEHKKFSDKHHKNRNDHSKKRFNNWQPTNPYISHNPYNLPQERPPPYMHNNEWHPREQKQFFNGSGQYRYHSEPQNSQSGQFRYQPGQFRNHSGQYRQKPQNNYQPFKNNEHKPREDNNTVSMRTVSNFAQKPRQQMFEIEEQDARDKEIQDLRARLEMLTTQHDNETRDQHFLETSMYQNHKT